MSGRPAFDLYDEIGIISDANDAQIREAYIRLARMHHPDGGSLPDASRMARINVAYSILSDPDARAEYDLDRWSGNAPRSNSRSQPSASGAGRRLLAGVPGWVWALAVLIGIGACSTYFDEQEQRTTINAQNSAASRSAVTAVGSGASSSQSTDVFDLRIGDCLRRSNAAEVESVTTVPCSSALADYQVTLLFTVAASSYPGDSYFVAQASARCPSTATTFLSPSNASWGLGDRTITCLSPLR